MNLIVLGLILTAIGDILIALGVLRVHSSISHEGKIDDMVVKNVKLEKTIIIMGIFFIILGFFVQISGI